MDQFVRDLVIIRKNTLEALWALNGTVWTEFTGELQYQNKEMPNWIVVDARADLRAAHQALVDIFQPYFEKLGDVNVTVSYTTGTGGRGIQRAFFDTNEEIKMALSDAEFGRA